MASGRRDALILGAVGIGWRPRRLFEWQGRALLCNFWATWCAPCREEVPLLVAAKQKGVFGVVELVGIGIDSADKIRQFAEDYKINYPLLVADATAVTLLRGLGNKSGGLPFSVALDRTGAVVARHLGAVKEAELRQLLASLVG